VLGLCLLASTASAQRLHGHPQKAAYASPAEWPVASSQCHWRAAGVNDMPEMPAHTHNDLQFPLYAEVGTAPFTVPFTFTLFDTKGKIIGVSGSLVTNWSLDAAKLPLTGNPAGVLVFTGHVTFVPSLGVSDGSVPLHGWYTLRWMVRTQYDNGDVVDNQLSVSVYSVIDPTQPERQPGDGTGRILMRSQCVLATSRPGVQTFGASIMEFQQLLPLFGNVSADKPWNMNASGYNYGGGELQLLPPGVFEFRLDPDLHHGIPGTTLDSNTASSTTRTETLPNLIPDGPHKLMFMWHRPSASGDEELVSNLVYNITAGPDGVAQPPNLSEVPQPGPMMKTVPNVMGLTVSAAAAAITNAGLVLGSITQATSGTIPPGNVISSTPAAGTKLNPGSSVSLTVSSGVSPPPRRVASLPHSAPPSRSPTR
jgi:hypothetical protein